jgi:two-component system sensor histidine kinase KdpD
MQRQPGNHLKTVAKLYAFFISQRARSRATLANYATAAVLVALTVGAAFVFRRLPHANVSLLFLMVVLLIAARFGLGPSIFASLLSFLALNFFFTEPLYTFAVEEEGDFATLLFFLAMAALTGRLAARMRSEAAKNRGALARVSALLDFSRRMAAATGADEALQALVDRLAAASSVRAIALTPGEGGTLALTADSARGTRRPPIDLAAMASAWGQLTAGGRPRAPGWTLLPLLSGGAAIGIAAVETADMEDDQKALIEGLCDQASIAAERARLVDRLRAAELDGETERLRSALLSSVSHDLRTPLVSIIGATTSLLEYRSILKPEDREELQRTVLGEAERLNRYIQNLLDMTRLGQPSFTIRREWVDLNDLISSAIARLGSVLGPLRVTVNVAEDAALLEVQGALMEQLIVNLLDNAAGFAPAGSAIEIQAFRQDGDTCIEVANEGPVIPEAERERIFDMFYRIAQGDRNRPGAGLGLAICRSIVAAHGGTIAAGTRADGTGALLRIHLPRPNESASPAA